MRESKNRVIATIGTVVAAAAITTGVAFGATGSTSTAPATPSVATPLAAAVPAAPAASGAPDAAEKPDAAGVTETGEKAAAPGAESANDSADSAAEKAESAKLAAQAKVTEQQAKDTALAKTPGTVTGSDIGDENGTISWEIDITGTDGTQHEVQINATTGAVLAADTNGDD